MHDLPAGKGQVGLDVDDVILGHRKVVAVEYCKVSELPGLDLTLLALFTAEPGPRGSPVAQRVVPVQTVGRLPDHIAATPLARDRPMDGEPGIVGRYARGICSCGQRHAGGYHLLDGHHIVKRSLAVAILVGRGLERNAVLVADAATEACDTLDRRLGDRLSVVEDPVQFVQPPISPDLLDKVEQTVRAFLIGAVEPNRPTVVKKNSSTGRRSPSIRFGNSGRG